jgi:precorrin-6A/cobalt-precorrin-6A reductase
LQAEGITHVVDATHPFAAGMSRNAVQACAEAGVPLAALERPGWAEGPQDQWTRVQSMAGAAEALPVAAAHVFLAIGRQNIAAFTVAPQHHYLLRLVDPVVEALPLPQTEIVIDRGPFRVEDDVELLRQHRIQIIVAKNAGGTGASAKIEAARLLGLPIVMIDRPEVPHRQSFASVAEVMAWLGHSTLRGV